MHVCCHALSALIACLIVIPRAAPLGYHESRIRRFFVPPPRPRVAASSYPFWQTAGGPIRFLAAMIGDSCQGVTAYELP
jgi:hypothetical protein